MKFKIRCSRYFLPLVSEGGGKEGEKNGHDTPPLPSPFRKQGEGNRNPALKVLLLYFCVFILPCGVSPAHAADEKKSSAEELLERRQKVEILSFFLKDPDKAVLPEASLAVEFLNQGVAHFEKNEFLLARKAIQDSLSHDSQNPLAYELLGEIDHREQKLAAAKANFEIAYNLNARPELKEKIEKLQGESVVEKKFSTYQEEHFLIKYYRENQQDRGFELRELLRTTYLSLSKDFAYYFKHQVAVLLYDEKDFKEITQLPHWVAGVYDGRVRMPINRAGFNELDLKALTAHEVTHAFVAAMSKLRAPAWLNEGLAEYEENKIKPVDLTIFESAVKTQTLFPLDQLISQTTTASLSDSTRVALFYQQSFHFVNYLIERYGMFRVKELLGKLGEGKDSDQAIHAVLKVSPTYLEREWKATLTK